MWFSYLALPTVGYLVALVSAKNVTTSYSPNGPVVINAGGTSPTLFNETLCQGQVSTIASVDFDGATVSFSFTGESTSDELLYKGVNLLTLIQGTALTLYGLTDIDRGLYNISTTFLLLLASSTDKCDP